MHVGVCVCVCVRACERERERYDMVFRDNIVQAANMISVTHTTYVKRNWIQRAVFWKQAGQILRKMDKIISENSKIPIFLLFLSLMQLLEI